MRLARAQRLTGRATELGRAEARSAVRGRGVPGGSHVRPTRTTETGPRDDRPHTGATSLQTCLVFSAPRPRPSKSPGIHRKNLGGRPRAIPECEHQRDWVAVGAVSREPVSHVDKRLWCMAPGPSLRWASSIGWSCGRGPAHDLRMKSRVHPKYKTNVSRRELAGVRASARTAR